MNKKSVVLFFISAALIAISISSVFAEDIQYYSVYNQTPKPIQYFQSGNAESQLAPGDHSRARELLRNRTVVIWIMKRNPKNTAWVRNKKCSYGAIPDKDFDENNTTYLKPGSNDQGSTITCNETDVTATPPA